MTANLTISELLEQGVAQLTGRSESPALDAEVLLADALGQHRARLKSHPEEVPEAAASDRYVRFIERRAQGEPVAYIVGYKHFWTLKLTVTPAVLVPRPETELLVERALGLWPQSTGNVVDLGTGSGAIALALASERPLWRVTATDISEDALAVARSNAVRHSFDRVEFVPGRWLEPLEGRRFDLIVSNPPYIGADEPEMQSPALRYEPRGALSPPDGDALASLREIIRTAPAHLETDGWLLLEHGSSQAAQVAHELVARGFRHVRSHRDLAGHERMTEGQWA